MFDEQKFIARVEAAGADELADILMRPSPDEERALRAYFGDERYRRLHAMALRRNISRSTHAPKPTRKVVVIHGIMGSDLTSYSASGDADHIWIKLARLVKGDISRLRLSDDGRTGRYEIRATGIMKRYYGELILSLSRTWDVRAFWFDWRKDLNVAADELAAKISGWFGDDAPFHIVAHSMGGLVARTFIKNHPKRWDVARDRRGDLKDGGRLVMLGTPNHGSFAVPQIITGLEPVLRKIALFDLRHDLKELVEITNTFVGSYQMLPSPVLLPAMADLYNAETYSAFSVQQRNLDKARKLHEELSDIVDPDRMIHITGDNQPTLSGIKDITRLDKNESYELTTAGDGRVPHALGLLSKRGREVPTFSINEEHGNLASNETVIRALDGLLETGTTTALSPLLRASRAGDEMTKKQQDDLRRTYFREREDELKAVETHVARMQARSRNGRATENSLLLVSAEERRVEEMLMRGFLGDDQTGDRGAATPRKKRTHEADELQTYVPRLRVALIHGGIEDIDSNPDYRNSLTNNGKTGRVDAISVGHYIGVRPVGAELALDKAVSRVLPGKKAANGRLHEVDLIITQYAERGIIRGELGQPFFITDARAPDDDRIVAVAGMGEPGRFGAPELVVLARELCWSLGRLGKRHLATVLIGAGVGTLDPRDAILAWLRGASRALAGSSLDAERQLTRITFVEYDPRRIEEIDAAIKDVQATMKDNRKLDIEYDGMSQSLRNSLPSAVRRWEERETKRRRDHLSSSGGLRRAHSARADVARDGDASNPLPTQITVSLDKDVYRFGALTDEASIPERAIPLDPALVLRANDELAAAESPRLQFEAGNFLEQLLLPDDLRSKIYTDAPLVMLLDATTARIHWEMVAQTTLNSAGVRSAAIKDFTEVEDYFVGTGRGFTRRLRTTFAPPPEPPPPPRRILKILVVADPAEDARLPGAEEEGVEVADLFESFNKVYGGASGNRVEVTPLFGPREATRTNVLKHLMLTCYDVLHYAGHCVYDTKDPAASGWIFTNGERLSAKELNRIDRIPKFVFSNACESGITPDRSELRTDSLAPSFAESFFARGVSNFVCTAWPVDDFGARLFAKRLYSCLLGLRAVGDTYERATTITPVMHVAMRDARLAVANSDFGARTWGAYQHYGNPYLQFFDESSLSEDQDDGAAKDTSARQKRASRKSGRQTTKRLASKRPARKNARGGR